MRSTSSLLITGLPPGTPLGGQGPIGDFSDAFFARPIIARKILHAVNHAHAGSARLIIPPQAVNQ